MPRVLALIDARIEARARASREAHAWWPCREGCDACCRALARSPQLTEPEWTRLRGAISALPREIRERVLQRIRNVAPSTPVICPMLDRERGACLVYEARPVACRTYGFYTERDGGLHCGSVAEAVASNATDEPIIWGNGESIADDLRALGEPRSLEAWLEDE